MYPEVAKQCLVSSYSQLLAHPVLYDLLSEKWLGKFGELKMSSWFTVQQWQWLLLNIWCLFDLVMFPLLFALFYFYTKHLASKKKLKNRGKVCFLE